MAERRGTYGVLVGKPEGKRTRRRWEDNIKWISGSGMMEHGLD
jgi:hypothetical protein